MDERGQRERFEVDEEPPESEVTVQAHESRPGRLVFTEDGNTDGWIATDLAVDPEQ